MLDDLLTLDWALEGRLVALICMGMLGPNRGWVLGRLRAGKRGEFAVKWMRLPVEQIVAMVKQAVLVALARRSARLVG